MGANSVFSDGDMSDYDLVSEASQRSLESSVADLGIHDYAHAVYEPNATILAQNTFETARWSAEEINFYVRGYLEASGGPQVAAGNSKTDSSRRRGSLTTGNGVQERQSSTGCVCVYVDGSFDSFNAGHALQLRQAKLSFPATRLVVGVFSDLLLEFHGMRPAVPHVERCEIVRHCRWVDEVIADPPWQLDSQFLHYRRIDYVAVEEGASVDPACDKERVKGFDDMKKLGKVIPTRRTKGLKRLDCRMPYTTPATPIATTVEVHEEEEAEEPPTPSFIDDTYGLGY